MNIAPIHLGDILEGIIIAAIVALLAFIGWLWKRSIYGEFEEIKERIELIDKKMTDRIDKIEKKIEGADEKLGAIGEIVGSAVAPIDCKIKNIDKEKTDQSICKLWREMCTKNIGDRLDGLNSKIDQLIEGQQVLNHRIDGILEKAVLIKSSK
jgi:hypothetical protein